ncbi:hypothetical protein HDU97_005576 [Phlyctochytrium planicorne]|nr:hypothetical protein HDU97_005576 [Phlyctochytrium planicorne]
MIILFVPEKSAYVVERFGKFDRILEPGLSFLIPFIERIRYVQSLKENTVEIPTQSAITQDNVTLEIDGVLYYRIEDPYKASYGVQDPEYAVTQLAQTTMLTLDRTLAERTQLNVNIVNAINAAAYDWGLKCLRYEIRDIHPPENVVAAMHQQVSAERKKRAEILESEGARQSAINVAEGKKQSLILESEAIKAQQINQAEGESKSILLKAEAQALAIDRVSEAILRNGGAGKDSLSFTVAEKYIDAFGQLAKEGTTVVVPSNVSDANANIYLASLRITAVTMISSAVRSSVLRNVARAPVAKVAARVTPAAASHSLTVPYAHLAVTPFENGVPTEQVRELAPVEKKWDFWTTSDAFLAVKPTLGGYSHVPYGEVWVVQRGSSTRVLSEGNHVIFPFLDKVKAVKNVNTISMGIVSPTVKSADGAAVNAYAVVYLKVTDFIKSALYVDPESNQADSERAAAKIVKRILEQEVPALSVGQASVLSESNSKILSDKITSSLKAKADEYGLEVVSVEIRGAFSSALNLPDKLRALDPPLLLPEASGHNLANDYWADVITPPFFQKRKFGNEKEVVTPASVSLEWSVPSPPDYHHFNEVPRMTADVPTQKAVAAKH